MEQIHGMIGKKVTNHSLFIIMHHQTQGVAEHLGSFTDHYVGQLLNAELIVCADGFYVTRMEVL